MAAELEQTKTQARREILKRLALTPKKEVFLRYGWRPGEGERRGLERLDENIWRISEAHWADGRR